MAFKGLAPWRPISIQTMEESYRRALPFQAFTEPVQTGLVNVIGKILRENSALQLIGWDALARPATILTIQFVWLTELSLLDFPVHVLNHTHLPEWHEWITSSWRDVMAELPTDRLELTAPLSKEEVQRMLSPTLGVHFRFYDRLKAGQPVYLGNILEHQPELLFCLPQF